MGSSKLRSGSEEGRLVLFDMDGVLFDSEPLHLRAKRELLGRAEVELPELTASVGVSNRRFWEEMRTRFSLRESPEQLAQRQTERVLALLEREGRPSEGLLELLSFLERAGVRSAVASSSPRRLCEGALRRLGLWRRFCALSCGDEVPGEKPAPDVYLRALALCGCAPAHAVAVEDSSTGIAAARAAGLFCIGYRNPTSGVQNLAGADCTVDHLLEIPAILEGLWTI